MAVKLVIEPLFEADFVPCSFGFRPEKTPRMALSIIAEKTQAGYTHVVDVDLKSYARLQPDVPPTLKAVRGKSWRDELITALRKGAYETRRLRRIAQSAADLRDAKIEAALKSTNVSVPQTAWRSSSRVTTSPEWASRTANTCAG